MPKTRAGNMHVGQNKSDLIADLSAGHEAVDTVTAYNLNLVLYCD